MSPTPTRSVRALDLVLTLGSSPIWGPVLLVLGMLCRLLQGRGVLFRQPRAGVDGQPFDVLKFRTMIRDADTYLDASGMPTRERITPLGRRLRRTGLDELPQLLNVVRGDMSLVGPRPVLMSWLDRIPGGANHPRFRVRPGLTGRAQIAGRNTVPWSRRLELDAAFASAIGMREYLAVLLATPAALLRPTVSHDRNASTVDDLPAANTTDD